MGKKGDKDTGAAAASAERLVPLLEKAGDVTSKKMFGGVGLFETGTMFGIIDSAGDIFFRAGDDVAHFEAAGSGRHGKMPYFSVPDSVLDDSSELLAWAQTAIDASRAAKKK